MRLKMTATTTERERAATNRLYNAEDGLQSSPPASNPSFSQLNHYGTMPSAPPMKAEFGDIAQDEDQHTRLAEQTSIPIAHAEVVPLTSQVPQSVPRAALVGDGQNNPERPPPYVPETLDDSSVLLRSLNTRKSAHVVCQHCHREIMTRPVASSDGLTIIAIIILLFMCWPLFWLPLCFSCCMKTIHYCPFCQKQVGQKRALIPIPVACVAVAAGVFLVLRFVLDIQIPHIEFDSDDFDLERWFDDDRQNISRETQPRFDWPWDDFNDEHEHDHDTRQSNFHWPWDKSSNHRDRNRDTQQPRFNWPWDDSSNQSDHDHHSQRLRFNLPWDD